MTANRGVRKVTERILKKGNGIIVTDKDKDGYGWDEIPPGSKFVDYETGIEWVKLEDVFVDKATGKILGYGIINESDGLVRRYDGVLLKRKDGTAYRKDDIEILEQTNWVPAHTRNDGTLCVARDSKIAEETFTIIKSNDGSGNMEYANSAGEHKKFPIQGDGFVVFELERGSYIKGRNHLEVTIDDVLRCSVASGGLKELTEKRFAVSGGLKEGQEITARYICISRYGSPYQRVYINVDSPEDMEVADMWLHYDDYINTDTGTPIDGTVLSDEPLNSSSSPSYSPAPSSIQTTPKNSSGGSFSGGGGSSSGGSSSSGGGSSGGGSAADKPSHDIPPVVVCFGDSLTSIDSFPEHYSWTTTLQDRRPDLEIINSGRYGGFTFDVMNSDRKTLNMHAMNEAILKYNPSGVLITLGGNDITTQTDSPSVIFARYQTIVNYLRNKNIKVVMGLYELTKKQCDKICLGSFPHSKVMMKMRFSTYSSLIKQWSPRWKKPQPVISIYSYIKRGGEVPEYYLRPGDAVHLSEDAAEVVGNGIADTLSDWFDWLE